MIESMNKNTAVIPGSFVGQIKPQNLQEATEAFEALYIRNNLHAMRKASDALSTDDNPLSSKQQRMWREFADDQLALTLASQRSTGIANLLFQQLSNK